ncbi:MAG: YdcF family protein [Cyanobacteria bacterium]|nr:YdcF family protein [Cyanobacteriota bacterium]
MVQQPQHASGLMEFLLSKLLPLALYPLGLALLLQIVGLLGRRRRWGSGCAAAGVALLWLAAMPLVSRQLVWGLEERASRLTPKSIPRADAVLVLGGGLRPAQAPRRSVEVGEAGDRLLTGVELLRRGRAPWLVVTGGKVALTADAAIQPVIPAGTAQGAGNAPGAAAIEEGLPSEAASAARLAIWLGVPAARILRSDTPRNTAEEAIAIAQLARQRGWHSLLLVTSATHLPRALATFERLTPLRIIPVACDFQLPNRQLYGRPTAASLVSDLLPSADALATSTSSLKEHLGLLIYRLRGWS